MSNLQDKPNSTSICKLKQVHPLPLQFCFLTQYGILTTLDSMREILDIKDLLKQLTFEFVPPNMIQNKTTQSKKMTFQRIEKCECYLRVNSEDDIYGSIEIFIWDVLEQTAKTLGEQIQDMQIPDTFLLLPRGIYPFIAKVKQTTLTLKNMLTIDYKQPQMNDALPLFPNQKLVLEYLLKYIYTISNIEAGTASCVLEMRAGYGKTYVAAALCRTILDTNSSISTKNITPLRFLYVLPNSALANQAMEDFTFMFEQTNYKIGFYDSKAAYLGNDSKAAGPHDSKAAYLHDSKAAYLHDSKKTPLHITIIIINSAYKLPPKYFKQFAMVIFDEVHQYTGPAFRQIFWKCHCPLALGMSATIREGKFDNYYYKHLGRIITADKIPGVSLGEVSFKGNVQCLYYHGPPAYTQALKHEATGTIFCSYMYKQFHLDPYRATLILTQIKKLYTDTDQFIYVFFNERQSAEMYYEQLKLSPDVENLDVILFLGGSSGIVGKPRIILTTYGYSGTGLSIDRMTSIIFADPRKAKMVQICGRILRRTGNQNTLRNIIDIVDAKTSLAKQVYVRADTYRSYGFGIERETVKYTDLVPIFTPLSAENVLESVMLMCEKSREKLEELDDVNDE